MNNKTIPILIYTLIILNTLDIITTMIALKIGAAETNPIALELMNSLGFAKAAILKFSLAIVMGIISLMILRYTQLSEPESVRYTKAILAIIFTIATGFYFYVVISNLVVIMQQLGITT